MEILTRIRVNLREKRLIAELYMRYRAAVKVKNKLTEPTKVRREVR